MKKPHSLLLTAGLFSIIPMPAVTEVTRDDARKAMAWMSPLGLLLGGVTGALGAGVLALSGAPLLAAVTAIAALQLLVGAMHLDGLSDAVDGLAALGSRKAGRDAGRALEIMRAPDIGPMGVTAIVGALGVQASALAAAPGPKDLFVLMTLGAGLGRFASVVASRAGMPAARPGGFGALFVGAAGRGTIVVQLVAGAALAGGAGWWLAGPLGAGALVFAALAALGISVLWAAQLVRLLGGVTGDLLGALIEVTTTIFLALGAVLLAGLAG